MPSSICQSTSARNAPSSIDPSALNGVTSAVPHPRSDSPGLMRVPAACVSTDMSALPLNDVLHREDSSLPHEPFRGDKRAVGEHATVPRDVRDANGFEGGVENHLVRSGNGSSAHARDGNVRSPCLGGRCFE